jgi:hypothetical protein
MAKGRGTAALNSRGSHGPPPKAKRSQPRHVPCPIGQPHAAILSDQIVEAIPGPHALRCDRMPGVQSSEARLEPRGRVKLSLTMAPYRVPVRWSMRSWESMRPDKAGGGDARGM